MGGRREGVANSLNELQAINPIVCTFFYMLNSPPC